MRDRKYQLQHKKFEISFLQLSLLNRFKKDIVTASDIKEIFINKKYKKESIFVKYVTFCKSYAFQTFAWKT